MRRAAKPSLLVVAGFLVASCATGASARSTPNAATTTTDPTPVHVTTTAPGVAADQRDIAYAGVSTAERLDLYLPKDANATHPLVIWIHGGGWEHGDKSLGTDAPARRLLDAGFAVASLDYRLSHQAVFPAQIDDVKAAVRYLRANAASLGFDGTRIGAWGDSAGGYLAALLGVTGDVTTFDDASLGNAAVSSRVQAVVDWYGPSSLSTMDEQFSADHCAKRAGPASSVESRLIGASIDTHAELAATASPVTYVSADDPPILIEHGTADCLVPWQQSALLADALSNAIGSANVTQVMHDGAGHGGAMFTNATNVDRVAAFFTAHLR